MPATTDDPVLFDVGVIALAHAGTPVSETPLSYVRSAIAGEIDAVIPLPALVGAHHILASVYGYSNAEASALMSRLLDASRIHWYETASTNVVRAGFEIASTANVEGWDGFYAQVAKAEGVETLLTLDDDFDRIDGVSTEVVLSPEEFAELNEYLGDG
jgi:predicted nucleic acid-binding protein